MDRQIDKVWQEKVDKSKKIVLSKYNALDGVRIQEYIGIPSDKDLNCIYMSKKYLETWYEKDTQ